MDIAAFLRVLWRFRFLVVAGAVLAGLAAFLSIARVDFAGGSPQVSYRAQEQWISSSTVLVTQDGFPWGRAILDEVVPLNTPGETPSYIPRYGDAARYSGLAALYAELAKSDEVRRNVLRGSTEGQSYDAQVVESPESGSALPLIYMIGYGPTPETAVDVANRATNAFRRFLEGEQARNGIPARKRVDVVVTQEAATAQIHEGRSLARPIFLFLLVSMVFVALSFVLENLKPSSRPAAEIVAAESPVRVRRSA